MIEDVAVDGLVVYRLTRLVVKDRIGRDLREAVITDAYAYEHRDGYDVRPELWPDYDPDPPLLATLVTCPWCVSVWAAVAVAAARATLGPIWPPIARAVASATIAGFISDEAARRQ